MGLTRVNKHQKQLRTGISLLMWAILMSRLLLMSYSGTRLLGLLTLRYPVFAYAGMDY